MRGRRELGRCDGTGQTVLGAIGGGTLHQETGEGRGQDPGSDSWRFHHVVPQYMQQGIRETYKIL